MTQALEPTTNGQTNLPAQISKADRLVTCDDGEFSNLLDTRKFEHMWRVAMLFSKSGLVPTHFQGQPENCFIATSMAVRLKIDPFMFMQNTHVVHGKPGMEGKLAIALINTGGMFDGPLQFRFEGEGDSRSCVAWARLKSNGEVVEGPRVSIAIAKSEGWYKQNAKWQSIPELMLTYRAGSWFGRTRCPERMMGMQTVDELEDVGVQTRQVGSRVIEELSTVDERLSAPMGDGNGNGKRVEVKTITTEPAKPQQQEETPPVEAEPKPAETSAPKTEPKTEPAPAESSNSPDAAGPGKTSWDAMRELIVKHMPTDADLDTEAAKFLLGQYVRKALDAAGKRKSLGAKQLWDAATVEQQIGIIDLIEQGQFPYVKGK